MDSLLQEITMLPGVLGCFVFNGEQQIAGSKMPPIFRENSIKTIGNLLARTIQIGSMAQLHFKGIEIKYNESLLMVNPLPKGALLVIICEPDANKSLISMTSGMLAPDIVTAMPLSTTAPSVNRQAVPKPVPQQAQTPKVHQKQPEEAAIGAELAPILEQIKDALAMAIGPIAAPVMKDTIEDWAKESPPSLSSLPALALLLCGEINNDALEQEFMAEFKRITA